MPAALARRACSFPRRSHGWLPDAARLERGTLAAGLLRALAAADLSHRDGARCSRPAGGPARRAVPDRSPDRPAAARITWRPVDRRRPGRAARCSARKPEQAARRPTRCDSASGPPKGRPARARWSRPIRCDSVTSFRPRRRRRPSTWPAATTGWDRSPWSASTGPRSPRRASASRSPDGRVDGLRTLDDPLQHLLFLPDTEVELTLVGTEKLADIQLKVHPGKPPGAQARRRADVRRRLDAQRSDDAGDPADFREDRACLPALVPVDWACSATASRGVTLRAVGVGSRVTPVATIPLSIGATDDLGLAALRLQIDRTLTVEEKDKIETKTQRTTVPFPLPAGPGTPGSGSPGPPRRALANQIRPRWEPCSASSPRPTTVRPRRPDRPVRRARAAGGLAR